MNCFRRAFSFLIMITLALLTAAGCAAKTSPAVMVVAGENVTAREYAYFLRLNTSNADTAVGNDNEKTAKELAANQVILMHIIFEKAKAYGVTLTKVEEAQLKSYKKENIQASGGTAAYEKKLKESGLTDLLFDKISESSYLYQKLPKVLYVDGGPEQPSAAEMKAFFEKNYVTVTYIMKKTADENGNSLSDDVIAGKRKSADKLLAKIRSGADFLTLVKSDNEDSGLTETNGYKNTFTHAVLSSQDAVSSEFENASFALDVGGISGIVETETGFYIIKRLPLDEFYLEKNHSALISAMSDDLFSKQIKKWMDETPVTYTKEYSNITLKNLDQYLRG